MIQIDIYGKIEKENFSLADLAKKLKEEGDVTINIDSYGGDYDLALAAYNLLRSSGKKITTVNMGHAFSSASLLFLAGDNRISRVGSLWMMHKISAIDETGNAEQLIQTVEHLKKLDNDWIRIVMERTDLPQSAVENIMTTEEYLTSAQCLKMNISTAEEFKGKIAACADISALRNLANYNQKINIMNEEIKKEEEIKEEVVPAEKKAEEVVPVTLDNVAEMLKNILLKIEEIEKKLTAPVIEVEAKKEIKTEAKVEEKTFVASAPVKVTDILKSEYSGSDIETARKYAQEMLGKI